MTFWNRGNVISECGEIFEKTPIPLQLGPEIQCARGLYIRRGALIRIIILTSLIIGVERRVNSDFKIFRGTN